MTDLTASISSIRIPEDRVSALDLNWAKALAGMFAHHGQKVAIEVYPEGEGYVLNSGLHRLEAAKICGWSEIAIKIIKAKSEHEAAEYRLHEVMENIGRRELTILDRAHHLFEFDRVMKELHPELKKGGNKQTEKVDEDRRTAIFAIRADIAEKVGLSDRSIRMAVQLWKALSKETRARVEGTWLANHQAGLMALAGVGAKQQANILEVLFDPEQPPKSVAEAIEFLDKGALLNSREKQIKGLLSGFAKLDDSTFDLVLSSQRERVAAWLERQGEA